MKAYVKIVDKINKIVGVIVVVFFVYIFAGGYAKSDFHLSSLDR